MLVSKFEVIYADPPWPYSKRTFPPRYRAAIPYPSLTLSELEALDVACIAAKDSVLLMWVTAPFMEKAIRLMGVWGFRFRTVAFTWVKANRVSNRLWCGLGFYTKPNAEFCLLGTRGKNLPRLDQTVKSVVITRVGRHSEKPEEIRHRIERLFGEVRRVELFARKESPGWTSIGNEIDGRDIRDVLPVRTDSRRRKGVAS